jgi:D-tyrosyl-tRNA(Tyr) deacylase
VRAVLQRASRASVTVDGKVTASFDRQGIVALVGVAKGDGPAQAEVIARKIAELRILDDQASVADVGAPVIVVSQFTLYANVAKGRRPSWNGAAPAEEAEPLITEVIDALRARDIEVGSGVFGAHMDVELVGDGPVTLIVDS